MASARTGRRGPLVRLARGLGWVLVFVVWASLGVLLHANTPALRQVLGEAVNVALQGSQRGRSRVIGIDHVGLTSSSVQRFEVLDEQGNVVLSLEGIRLRYHPVRLALGLVGSSGSVSLERLRVDRSRLVLATDEPSGEWTLVRALTSGKPPRQPREHPPLTLVLSAVELGEVEVVLRHPTLGNVQARIERLQGSAEWGGDDTSVAVQRFGVQVVAMDGSRLDGTGSFRLLPKGYVAGTFHGFLDGTELEAAGQFDADILTLRLDVPRALPESVRQRLPMWPLQAPLTAHFEAQGALNALGLRAQLSADASRVEAVGSLDLVAGPKAHVTLTGHALDARLFSATAPATALELQAEADLALGAVGPTADVKGAVDATSIAGSAIPRADFDLHFETSQVNAELRLADGRGRVDADLTLREGKAAELSVKAQRLELGAWPWLRGQVAGRLDLSAHASLDEARVLGKLDGRLSNLSAGALRASRAQVTLTFAAPRAALEQASIESVLEVQGLDIGPLHFEGGQATSQGGARQSHIGAELWTAAGARSRVEGTLAVDAALELRDVDLEWTDPTSRLVAHVRRFAPEPKLLQVDSFALTGAAGSLHGSGELQPGSVTLSLDAADLDVARLSRAWGVELPQFQGQLTGKAELAASPEGARGSLEITAKSCSIRDVALGTVVARATLAEGEVELTLDNGETPLGQLSVLGKMHLGGSPLELQSWQTATGSGSLSLAKLPLWPLGLLLSKPSRIQDLQGSVDAKLEIERSDSATLPNLFLSADTKQLEFRVAGSDANDAEGTLLDHFAAHASLSVDGRNGHGQGTLLLTDERGALVSTSGALDIDLHELLEQPNLLLSSLSHTPLDALLRLHPRPLSQLPPPFGIRDLAGSVEATLQLRGTLLAPKLTLAVHGQELLGGLAEGGSVDASGVVHYAPDSGVLTGDASVIQGGKSLVSARLEGNVPSGLYASPVSAPPELRAAAMLNGVPLELWPAAASERIQARVYGSVDFERKGAEVRQRAHLELGELSVHGHPLGNGRLTFESHDASTRADLRVGSRDHYLRATLEGVMAESGAAPSIQGSLAARAFDAASLSPLTSGILTRLAGSLDANLTFVMKPKTASGWYLGIDGEAQLKDGSAHVDTLGLEVREIAATLEARSTPDYSVLKIAPFEGKARSRNANLRGDAELWLDGVRLVNGEANLSLNDVPLSLEGASRGTARGRVKGRLERRPGHMALDVEVPELRVKLPPRSTRTLIELDANPDVNVAQVVEQTAPPARDAMLWKIAFELGKDVRITRGDLDVPLTGQPLLEYQHEVRPSGTIEALPGGRLSLFGLSFSIDHGVVELMPDAPGNPKVDITASWRAPDGTTVYVDITGRAKDASVLTRDDRGLQDVERFALITGSAGSVAGTETGELGIGAQREQGALGQTFALGINELLLESVGNVAVNIGTTADARASYGASVRLSDKLSFQGAFQPASAIRPEETTSDLTGTLDYQFSRHWSLRTELGTSGGAFDLLWNYRY